VSMQWETEVLPVLRAVHAVLANDPFPANGAERSKIEDEFVASIGTLPPVSRSSV